MRRWLVGEPSLDELLADDIMGPVVASAGISREQLRLHITEMARRLAEARDGRIDERVAACGGVRG
jgi:hypothetical protein